MTRLWQLALRSRSWVLMAVACLLGAAQKPITQALVLVLVLAQLLAMEVTVAVPTMLMAVRRCFAAAPLGSVPLQVCRCCVWPLTTCSRQGLCLQAPIPGLRLCSCDSQLSHSKHSRRRRSSRHRLQWALTEGQQTMLLRRATLLRQLRQPTSRRAWRTALLSWPRAPPPLLMLMLKITSQSERLLRESQVRAACPCTAATWQPVALHPTLLLL